MPYVRKKPIINHALLAARVKRSGQTKSGLARKYGFHPAHFINWTLGCDNPSEQQLARIAKMEELDLTVEQLLIPGEIYVAKGWQAALTAWSDAHQNYSDRPLLSDNDAISLLKVRAADTLEEAFDDETGEEEFSVPGPEDTPDASEPERD